MSATESVKHSSVESSGLQTRQSRPQIDETLSPALLEAVFEASAEGIVVHNSKGRIVFANASAERILHMSADQLMGRSAHDPEWYATTEDGVVIAPADHPSVHTLRTGEPLTDVVMIVHSSLGKPVYVSVSTRPLFLAEQAKPAGVVITFADVTQAKLNERALRDSERRFRGIFEQTSQLSGLLDPNGIVLEINQTALAFADLRRDEVVGLSFAQTAWWTHDTGIQDQIQRAVEQAAAGAFVRFEVVARGRGDQLATIDFSIKPVLDDMGNVVLLIPEGRDITEQKLATAALRASDLRFHQAFDNSPIGKALVGLTGNFLHVNAALCKLTGYDEPDLLQQTFQGITHPADLESDLIQLQRLKSGEITSYELEKRYIRKDGEIAWVLLSCTMVRTTSGEPDYYVAQVLDVTERKQAEDSLAMERDLLHGLLDNLPELVSYKDIDSRFIRINKTGANHLRLNDPAEAIGKCDADFVPEEAARSFVENDREVMRTRVPILDRLQRLDRDGETRWLSATKAPTFDRDGNVTGVVAISRDVTERVKTEAALRVSEERFRGAFVHAPIGIALVGFDQHFLQVNRKLCELLGFDEQTLLTKSWIDVTHEVDVAPGQELLRQLANGEIEAFELETQFVRVDGEAVWTQVTVSLVRDVDGVPQYSIAQIRDVTERRVMEERLRRMALHDPLTDLPNRTLLSDRLSHALTHISRLGARVAVLFLDLDRFKIVNDDLGHLVGDALLCAVSERLSAMLRASDTLARVSGDEFVVVLEGLHANHEATEIAARIIAAFEIPFTLAHGNVHIGVSIGIAYGHGGKTNPEELLRDADVALYRAKAAGRNQYAIFDTSMSHVAAKRLAIERDLRGATERGELELHYQPVIELDTGAVSSVEALVRWRHPKHGLIGPADFIGMAEESGLIVPIGRWVVREACQQLAEWGEQIQSVAVNLSARQFREIGLVDELASELARAGLEPNRLTVEITEHLLVEDVAATAATLSALRALGVSVAIDDFGTGYSSLGYLRHLPVDVIKLDRSFVRGLGTDAGSIAIVESIAALAHTLGLKVTAEGIETAEQLAYVRSAGCDRGQGFLFAKPAPANVNSMSALRGDSELFEGNEYDPGDLESLKLPA